jgi:hypothetical protein
MGDRIFDLSAGFELSLFSGDGWMPRATVGLALNPLMARGAHSASHFACAIV